jgi:hypothetical protein
MIWVGGQFFVKPLFEWLNQDQHFYILAISQDELRLLEGKRHGIEEVDLVGVPSSLAEALRWDDPDKQSQFHTVGRGDESGWQGRVTEIDARPPDPPLITIQWHSITLRKMSRSTITRAEKEGLDWSTMGLYASKVEPAAPPDTFADVESTLAEIASHVA